MFHINKICRQCRTNKNNKKGKKKQKQKNPWVSYSNTATIQQSIKRWKYIKYCFTCIIRRMCLMIMIDRRATVHTWPLNLQNISSCHAVGSFDFIQF